MKKTLPILLAITFSATFLSGCRAESSEVGPQGPQGIKGEDGKKVI